MIIYVRCAASDQTSSRKSGFVYKVFLTEMLRLSVLSTVIAKANKLDAPMM
jgi:hypothetical protein